MNEIENQSKKYYGFNTRGEYLRHTKIRLRVLGKITMVLATTVILGMFLVYGGMNGDMESTIMKFFQVLLKLVTISFAIGAIAVAVSMTIKIDDVKEE